MATYVLFVMLQFGTPDPHNSYGIVQVGGSATTAEFSSAEKCADAAHLLHDNFTRDRVLVTTFCSAK